MGGISGDFTAEELAIAKSIVASPEEERWDKWEYFLAHVYALAKGAASSPNQPGFNVSAVTQLVYTPPVRFSLTAAAQTAFKSRGLGKELTGIAAAERAGEHFRSGSEGLGCLELFNMFVGWMGDIATLGELTAARTAVQAAIRGSVRASLSQSVRAASQFGKSRAPGMFGSKSGSWGLGEILKRLGTSKESAARLGRKSAEAEEKIGIHGVSATAGEARGPASEASRASIEAQFRVHDTPSLVDPLHRTIELPRPVTPDVADMFNRLFGRAGK